MRTFMGFPVPCAGVLPKLLLTAAISISALLELCRALLDSVGLVEEEGSCDDGDDNQPILNVYPADVGFDPAMVDVEERTHSRMAPPPGTATWDHHAAAAKAIQASLPVLRLGAVLSMMQVAHDDDDDDRRHPHGLCCAVCLCELTSHHQVRQLARCHHVFHVDCIDGWLQYGHITCPLCRTSLSLASL